MTYQEANDYIAAVPKFTKKNTTGHTREFLRRLGDPQEQMKIVHVAGTNGKGSVCAFMAQALSDAGFRTGLFTSPHLVRINERFRINGEEITDGEFARIFTKVKEIIDGMVSDGLYHPTYFEILFGMGMLWFAQSHVQYLVMETGLGGRLDATNAIPRPVLCVITSISFDHMEYLGNTIEQIASEKAGIIKEGIPVVYDACNRKAAGVIAVQAQKMHAPAIPFYREMALVTGGTDRSLTYVLNNRYFDYREVTVPFIAQYQVVNSAIALMALRVLDPDRKITDQALIRSIGRTSWPGRMELLMPGVVVDGAHNADGIEQFLKTVRAVEATRPVSLLFAAVVEKDYEGMIREICQEAHFQNIVVTQIEGSRKVEAGEFARIFRKYTDVPVQSCPNVREAFREALKDRPQGGMLFCAGSLYLVGELEAELKADPVRAHESEPDGLKGDSPAAQKGEPSGTNGIRGKHFD